LTTGRLLPQIARPTLTLAAAARNPTIEDQDHAKASGCNHAVLMSIPALPAAAAAQPALMVNDLRRVFFVSRLRL
jgi:hypothetical protein